MATTLTRAEQELIRRLVAAHQATESREAAKIVAAVVALYRRSVRIDNPASVERWLALVIPKIMEAYDASALRGTAFANKIRLLEVGVDDFRYEALTGGLNENQLRTSLMVTGVKNLQSKFTKIRDLDEKPVMKQALYRDAVKESEKALGGATLRHALNGGRDSVRQGALNDPQALGYVRVTKGDPCWFCAMLASRGPTYQDDSFEDSDVRFTGAHNFKVHDDCKCGLKPSYRRTGDPLEADWKPYEERWDRLAKQYSGWEVALAFRAEHEGRVYKPR